jgi:IS605 OrfB family transposase
MTGYGSTKPQRATLHNWAFAQLGKFLIYKAENAGIVIIPVDPSTHPKCVPNAGLSPN